MLNLRVKITLKGKDTKFINKRDINKYLEYMCTKFADESIDTYEFEGKEKSFNINCKIHNNKIDCYINCSSYEKALQLSNGILRLDTFSFLDYKFEINSLELKEMAGIDMNSSIVDFAI